MTTVNVGFFLRLRLVGVIGANPAKAIPITPRAAAFTLDIAAIILCFFAFVKCLLSDSVYFRRRTSPLSSKISRHKIVFSLCHLRFLPFARLDCQNILNFLGRPRPLFFETPGNSIDFSQTADSLVSTRPIFFNVRRHWQKKQSPRSNRKRLPSVLLTASHLFLTFDGTSHRRIQIQSPRSRLQREHCHQSCRR